MIINALPSIDVAFKGLPVLLDPHPEDFQFSLVFEDESEEQCEAVRDVFNSLVASRVDKNGVARMSPFDLWMFRSKINDLGLLGLFRWHDARSESIFTKFLERSSLLQEVKKGSLNDTITDNFLKHAPYDDQKSVIAFSLLLDKSGDFSTMGLGKTFSGMYWFSVHKCAGKVNKCIVFCLNNNKSTWRRQLEEHTDLTYTIVRNGTHKVKKDIAKFFLAGTDVLIIHYDCLKSVVDDLAGVTGHAILIDEAHVLRHLNTHRSKAFFKFLNMTHPNYVHALTGTAVNERPEDAYAIIKAIAPYLVRTKEQFIDCFCVREWRYVTRRKRVKKVVGYKNLEWLRALLSLVSVRKTVDEVQGMPKMVLQDVPVSPTTQQLKLYNQIATETYREVAALPQKALNLNMAMVKTLRLRQLLNHPSLLGEPGDSGKYLALDALLEEVLSDSTAKAVVWSVFVPGVDLLAERYRQYGALKMHGDVDNRDEVEEAFLTSPDTRVLVATPGTAGTGKDFTCSRYALYVDKSLCATEHFQSMRRTVRRGMTGTSVAISLRVPGSVDDWVENLLMRKKKLAMALQDSTKTWEEDPSVDKQELLDCLKGIVML